MTLYEIAAAADKKLAREEKALKKRIIKAPEGTLYCTKSGGKSKFYKQMYVDGKKIRKYIPRSQETLIKRLAQKTWDSYRLRDIQDERRGIAEYMHKHRKDPSRTEELLQKKNEYRVLLTEPSMSLSEELREWRDAAYDSTPKKPENRTISSVRGIYVRSKAEDMIACALDAAGIPFHYEEKIIIGNQAYHPDFTIRHPVSGEIYLWEHLGMMDRKEYADFSMNKLQHFYDAGYTPGVNLILTFETENCRLSSVMIDALISNYFQLTPTDQMYR